MQKTRINKLALIGKNISHSHSKKMYEELLGYKIDYDLIDCPETKDIPSLDHLFTKKKYQGISITSPYKDHFLKKQECIINPLTRTLGSVNAVKQDDNNYKQTQYFATNTDFWAIQNILLNDYICNHHLKNKKNILFLVLGNGLMANITTYLLNTYRMNYQQIYRKKYGNLDYFNFPEFVDNENIKINTDETVVVIINACSRDFIYKGEISNNYLFWDYNYSIDEHENRLSKKVFHYQNGLSLLKLQAKYALSFFIN